MGVKVIKNNGIGPARLRCEYRLNPLGIDVVRPRLSWVVESQRRGRRQSAYQIIVAGSAEKLEKGLGDLWDSGKVESGRSIHVVYAGDKLKSQMRCFWKVRIWGEDGVVSDWSESAWWEMSLLEAGQWKGGWINDGKGCPEKDEDFYKEDPVPLFRKEFSLKSSVKRARLYIAGLGYYQAQ